MKLQILVILGTALLGCSPLKEAKTSCELIIGDWVGKRFEKELNLNRKNFSTYNKDGTWNLRIELVSNDVNYNFTESGTFSCHGNNLITYVREVDGEKLNDNSLFHEYLINEITEKKFIFEAINVKCENVESDCDNTKYEVYKNEK